MRSPLTPKEQLFVEEYLVDLNGRQAAIRAGYSRKSADVIACQLLKRKRVDAAIEEAKNSRIERLRIEQDQIIRTLTAIVLSDIADYQIDFSTQKIYTNPNSATATQAISAFEYKEQHSNNGHTKTYTIRLWSKVDAARLLLQHLRPQLSTSTLTKEYKTVSSSIIKELAEE